MHALTIGFCAAIVLHCPCPATNTLVASQGGHPMYRHLPGARGAAMAGAAGYGRQAAMPQARGIAAGRGGYGAMPMGGAGYGAAGGAFCRHVWAAGGQLLVEARLWRGTSPVVLCQEWLSDVLQQASLVLPCLAWSSACGGSEEGP